MKTLEIEEAIAGREQASEKLPEIDTASSDASEPRAEGSFPSNPAYSDASLVDRRLEILGSVLGGVSSHVEALEFAENHNELRERENELRRDLNAANCEIDELREQIADKLAPLQSELQARWDDWMEATRRKQLVMLEYEKAAWEAAKSAEAYDAAVDESDMRQRELLEADQRKTRAQAAEDTQRDAFQEVSKEVEELTDDVRKLGGHLGRASALYADYRFMARRVREQIPQYFDDDTKFVHLLDGGVADNLGITPLLELLRSFQDDFYLDKKYFKDWKIGPNRVAVFSVDARAASASDFGKKEISPSFFGTVGATVSTAIEGKSSLLTRELEQIAEELVNDGIVSERYLIRVNFDSIRNFHSHEGKGEPGHVHGRETQHEEPTDGGKTVYYPRGLERCTKAFKRIPTDWNLDEVEKNALVEMGYALVLDSFAYTDFVAQFDGDLPRSRKSVDRVCSTFTEPLEKLATEREEKKKKRKSRRGPETEIPN